ncbi:DUF418 domain-containing protein [Sphingomonas jeddahensis]|uniref:DUF418 domain-containing protein n=1 Tax=Sphingomonas jeddahensis TaxID=1915074 RepID=A0A1V2ET94_9SPHN|nr:DUF418 domain-containing protein [Sphingomonas jeddahensis]ONF95891.1 hypothetical protein SPHI_18170 [Sphingomonas jeddahensis]
MTAQAPTDRIATIDVVRGVAVLGILLPNIVAFAMPSYAYLDPTVYGGAEGANWWAWAVTFVVADGKMRGLFTLLFGASTVLIAERAAAGGGRPVFVHYARMISLLAIGMVHAYLIWSGDILVLYAICGAVAFVAWRWDVSRLLAIAALLMVAQLASGVMDHSAARYFEARATAADAASDVREKWATYQAGIADVHRKASAEVAAFGEGWRKAASMRVSLTWDSHRNVLPRTIPETLALMLAGMALYRSGFFHGRWPRQQQRAVLLLGFGIGLPSYALVAWWISASGFDPITLLLTEPLHLVLLRPAVTLAYATATIWLVQSGALPRLAERLAAVGQMALSNYLGTSLICTYLFHGYGLGWFGALERWQLYPVVAAVWIAIICWSKPLLARFGQGPAEWAWRAASARIAALMRRAAPLG